MTDSLYLAGVTNCVVGALGRGDLKLFDRILKDLRRYPDDNPSGLSSLSFGYRSPFIFFP